MDAIRSFLRTLRRDQGGATAIEYGLIIALISIAAISAMSALGGGNGGMWDRIGNNVTEAM